MTNKEIKHKLFKPQVLVLYGVDKPQKIKNKKERKLAPTWEGPYRVIENFKNGIYWLETIKGKFIP